MQLIAIPRFRFNSTVFNPSLSAVLSGMTAVGAISAAIYHFDSARNKIGSSLISLLDTEAAKYLLSGVSKLGDTFQKWGSLIIGSKDAFAEWIQKYLNPHGLKSGISALYERLKAWALIVYNWFATKFIEFLGNIPRMVKDWDKLRLSLFKWGTFLGGGGGAALWAMFGSGANLAELGELMSNPKFADMMEKFGTLFNENREAFDELGAEGIQEILKEYLENPEKADKAADQLMQDQKDKKEKAEKEAQEKKEEMPEEAAQLTAEEIMERYKPSAGGNPPNKTVLLGTMVKGTLGKLLEPPKSVYSMESHQERARKFIDNYLKELEEAVKKRPNKIKDEFLKIIGEKREAFVKGLAEAAGKAFQGYEPLAEPEEKAKKIKELADKFIKALTVPSNDGQGDAAPLVEALNK